MATLPVGNHLISFFLYLITLTFVIVSQSYVGCASTVYVRTSGKIINGGTDSIINHQLNDAHRNYIEVPNHVEERGLMEHNHNYIESGHINHNYYESGHNHNYFETGNVDIFTTKRESLSRPACAVNLKSDGSGAHHGYYSNYVEVTASDPRIPCTQKLIKVEQWRALDTSPHKLTVTRNNFPLPVVASDNHVYLIKTVG